MAGVHPNRPRWRGEAGFFEIWFLVVFEVGAERAWWLRYTTFAPAPGQPGAPRAVVWAAAFDAGAAVPAVVVKRILPAAAFDAGPADRFAIRVGDAELADGVSRGRVEAEGHAIAWDLRFDPSAGPAARGPAWLERLARPTRVAHAHPDVVFDGWVEVDGARRALAGARGLQTHIWGTRRVEELFWLYCPQFVEDQTARLEAFASRLDRRAGGIVPVPPLASVWLRTAAGERQWWDLPWSVASRVAPGAPGELRVRAWTPTRALAARAWCEPGALAAWVYRDPAGRDLHVAQSDVASCAVELWERPHPLAAWGAPRRLTVRHGAAVEFHHPEPLPGVGYLAWDACGAAGEPADRRSWTRLV
jgi:hypothetical protein